MKISALIDALEAQKDKHGDVEVTMTGTFLPDGYCGTEGASIADVFESTVETPLIQHGGKFGGTRLRLFWQC